MTKLSKEDDYTLLVTNELPTGGKLCRYFNFAAQQVTTIFVQKAEMEKSIGSEYSANGRAVSVSTAITSQMQIQKFSDLDGATQEIEAMHVELKDRGGNPPDLSETLTRKLNKPSRSV